MCTRIHRNLNAQLYSICDYIDNLMDEYRQGCNYAASVNRNGGGERICEGEGGGVFNIKNSCMYTWKKCMQIVASE